VLALNPFMFQTDVVTFLRHYSQALLDGVAFGLKGIQLARV